MSLVLSVCIPTYNRSGYLSECLNSVLGTVVGHEHEVEIVISDNASTDDTGSIIRAFQEIYPWIRYYRSEKNMGGERNFRHVATLAAGENIWVFGDDDRMAPNAVLSVLESIRAGHNLIVCNYSLWDKQFLVQFKKCAFPVGQNETYDDPNKLMENFGLHLGYISSVVMKKVLFLALPAGEYDSYAEYGFPFLYAVYNGVVKGTCKVEFISETLFYNRGGNSGDYDWYKYFVTGSSLIFDDLIRKGYDANAVAAAKLSVLNDFVSPNIIGLKLQMTSEENKHSLFLLYRYYKSYWRFWFFCFPKLLTPIPLIQLAKIFRQKIRHRNSLHL